MPSPRAPGGLLARRQDGVRCVDMLDKISLTVPYNSTAANAVCGQQIDGGMLGQQGNVGAFGQRG